MGNMTVGRTLAWPGLDEGGVQNSQLSRSWPRQIVGLRHSVELRATKRLYKFMLLYVPSTSLAGIAYEGSLYPLQAQIWSCLAVPGSGFMRHQNVPSGPSPASRNPHVAGSAKSPLLSPSPLSLIFSTSKACIMSYQVGLSLIIYPGKFVE